MRAIVLVVGVAACGGPGSTPGGGGDASPDGVQCLDDQDGDGVCDATDLCPSIADPGQADLDGDHIGWACDAIESTVLANLEGFYSVRAQAWGPSFGATVFTSCSTGESCRTVIAAVSPAGAVFGAKDSMQASDAWLAAATTVRGPYVSQEWSTGVAAGELDLGDQHLLAIDP